MRILQDRMDVTGKGGEGAARKEGQLQIKRWGGKRKGQVRRK